MDPQLQMLALSLAVLRGSNNVQGLAKKLLEDVGGAFDLWDKIINERNATLSEVHAAALATQGIDRFAGPSRLALARGRVLVMAGNTEAGVQVIVRRIKHYKLLILSPLLHLVQFS